MGAQETMGVSGLAILAIHTMEGIGVTMTALLAVAQILANTSITTMKDGALQTNIAPVITVITIIRTAMIVVLIIRLRGVTPMIATIKLMITGIGVRIRLASVILTTVGTTLGLTAVTPVALKTHQDMVVDPIVLATIMLSIAVKIDLTEIHTTRA